MKRIAIIGSLALVATALASGFLKVDAVLKDGKKYDKKDVVVRGKVDDYKKKTSKAGNKYTTFKVQGESKFINVYLRDHLKKDLKDGDIVEVNGIFRLEKEVGGRKFKNEIEITAVKGKKYGVKVIPPK